MRLPPAIAALAMVVAAISAVSAVAEDAVRQESAVNPNAAANPVQLGKALYARHCSHCHGMNMVSAGTVTYDLREFPTGAEERFFESVTNGKNNRMPPWGDVLTQDEIGAIWAYVLTRGKS